MPLIGVVMSHMDSKQLLSLSILAAKDCDDIPKFKQLKLPVCTELIALVKDFNYEKSIDFNSKVYNKSEAYRSRFLAMVQEPVRKTEIKECFYKSVSELVQNDDILKFLPEGSEERILKIRELLMMDGDS